MARAEIPLIDFGVNVPNMSLLEWKSQYYEEYSSMKGIHSAAKSIMNGLFPSFDDYDGFKLNPEDLLDFDQDETDVNDMIWANKGPLGLVIFSLIFAIIFTIVGICWCTSKFCCCCRKKKAKPGKEYTHMRFGGPLEPKKSEGKLWPKITCAVLMGIWSVFFLTGVIACFITNSQMKTAVNGMTSDLDNSLIDAALYLKTSQNQLEAVFVKSYQDLSEVLIRLIDEQTPETIRNSDSTAGVVRLNSQLDLLEKAEIATTDLKLYSTEMQTGLEKSKRIISDLVERFVKSNTEEINSKLSEQLPHLSLQLLDMNEDLQHLNIVLDRNITQLIKHEKDNRGQQIAFLNSNQNFRDVAIKNLKDTVKELGEELSAKSSSLTSALDDVPTENTRSEISNFEDDVEINSKIVFGVLVCICLILLTVIIVFIIGSVLNWFGDKTKSIKCCSKKSGNLFFTCGIFAFFLTGGVLMILAVACFILSGVTTQVICEAIRDLETLHDIDIESQVAFYVGKQNDGGYKLPSYANIVESCKNEKSVYVTFDLQQVYDIEDILKLSDNFTTELTRRNVLNSNFKDLVSLGNISELDSYTLDLNNFQVSLEAAEIKLSELITTSNLSTDNKNSGHDNSDLINRLNAEVKVIKNLQTNTLPLVQKNLKTLSAQIASLRESIVTEDNSIISVGRQQTDQEVELIRHVDHYEQFVLNTVMYEVGKCGPMYRALDTTIELFCYKIASPVAAFWFSLTFLLLLSIPIMITAVVSERLHERP